MDQEIDTEIEKGKLLIAMPPLVDPNFRQTVVLLCEHNPEGSLGLVLNRPTQLRASSLIQDLPDPLKDGRIYAGGPVGRNAMLVLCRGDHILEGNRILDEIFLARHLDDLKLFKALAPQSGDMRYFLGYAGWAPGQLESEVKAGAWTLMPADANLIFDANPALVWQEMMRKLGGEWSIYATMPPDLSLN
jgi:putative transcriptional regulator